jgi:hypothetical protein
MSPATRRLLTTVPPLCALALAATALLAQGFGRQRPRGDMMKADDPRFTVHNVPYDARYTFVRLAFNPSAPGRGGGGYFFGVDYSWDHDYPTADRHFTTIVRELTSILPAPGTNILWIGSPELSSHPIAYMSEPGFWTQTDAEAENLRNYLLKGGFLIFDDFAGTQALGNLQRQLDRVLPGARLVEIPGSHPIFNSFFAIDPATQRSTYQVQPYFLGVYEDNDPARRLLLIANYNNDIGDAWEWSDQGFIPIDITNEAFKLGVNYLIYAMTH